MEEKPVLGLIEKVVVSGTTGISKSLLARVDTGAQNSSIDLITAQELRLGPIIKTKSIRNSHGHSLRPVVHATVEIGNKTITEEFTIANRTKMKYKLLIGQNILTKGFLIDPSKVAS